MRKIVIDDQTFEFKVGVFRVSIRDPARKGYYPTLVEICAGQRNWDEIERSYNKGCGFAIRPVLVENYIRRVILGQDVPLPTFQQTALPRPTVSEWLTAHGLDPDDDRVSVLLPLFTRADV